MRKLRRVVTGRNEAGKSIILFDGPPTQIVGEGMAELWYADETPTDNSGVVDTAVRPVLMQPPPGGSIFRYIEVPPEPDPAAYEARMKETMASLGANEFQVDTSRHPGMHQTNTIDYIVLLSGRVTMMMDVGEVDLEPFDLVVQRGTNHAWVNKGTEPALLLAANIDAKPF